MLSPKQLHKRRTKRTPLSDRAEVAMAVSRLSVHRTGRHISVQIIDDKAGKTLAAASTLEVDLRKKIKTGANKEAAKKDRRALIAERAIKAGIKEVVSSIAAVIMYHGRVKELAEAAREAGLIVLIRI